MRHLQKDDSLPLLKWCDSRRDGTYIMKSEKTREVDSPHVVGNYHPFRYAADAPSWHTVTYKHEDMSPMTYMSMQHWCAKHCQNHFSSHGVNYYFKSPEDEFEFRLRWGDHLHT